MCRARTQNMENICLNTVAQQVWQMPKLYFSIHLKGRSHRPNDEKQQKKKHYESNLSPALENAFPISIFSFQVRDKEVFSHCYSAGFHIWIWTIATKGEEEFLHPL